MLIHTLLLFDTANSLCEQPVTHTLRGLAGLMELLQLDVHAAAGQQGTGVNQTTNESDGAGVGRSSYWVS